MRYYLSNGDGQVYGPYTTEELRGFAAEGRVTAATQLCAEGTTAWTPATSVPGLGFGGVPPMAPPTGAGGYVGAPVGWKPVSLVWPILVTVFCCLIGGIVSIIYATQANSKAMMGDMAGAESAKRAYTIWMWVSVGLGLLVSVVYVVGMAASVGR